MTESFVKQRTLANEVSLVGTGLHSGNEVSLVLKPAPIGHGIVFQRVDVAEMPMIPAKANLITDTLMSSNLTKDGVKVGTVEHLLSAISAMGIDNLLIQVSASEIPIMDGSAINFIELIQQANIIEQTADKQFLQITHPIRVSDDDKWAELLPYNSKQKTGFQLTFEICFEHPTIAGMPQITKLDFSTKNFIEQISQARTFGFMKDIEYLRQNGLALGGNLDNAVVIDDSGFLNPEGLRFSEEIVRHKVLDAIGDLYLIGYPIIGQYNAYKSGHDLNNKLVKAVLSNPSCFNMVTINENSNPSIYY